MTQPLSQTTQIISPAARNAQFGCWWPERGTPGWESCWALLRAQWQDIAAENEHNGERWQHMGVWLSDDGSTWRVQFRHRDHPTTGKREYCEYALSAEDVLAYLPQTHKDEQVRRVQERARAKELERRRTMAYASSARVRLFPSRFREEDCGGAFDGINVTSDADPGL